MKFNILNDPFPHFIVEDIYNKDELQLINRELLFLASKMVSAEKTGAAKQNFRLLKKGQGVFLESIFRDTKDSDIGILLHNIIKPECMHQIVDKNNDFLIRSFSRVNCREVLVQMYKNGDYYNSHEDSTLFTSVLLIHKEPKIYTGGDLIFPEYNNYIPKLENNCAIYFPSFITHKVSEVKMESNADEDARFTITQFLGVGIFDLDKSSQRK